MHSRRELLEDQLDTVVIFIDTINELHQTANNLVEAHLARTDDIINITRIYSEESLHSINSPSDLNFIFSTNLYPEWSERYFTMLHSDQLSDELEVDPIQLQQDIDNQVIMLQTQINFEDSIVSAQMLFTQVSRLVCELFSVQTDEAVQLQNSLKTFGILDGNYTI
jgi:hypothetical protein